MLDEIGLFDERFFLYCEDTDLGLRARWAGWEGEYVAGAVVDHAYSKSAGRASALKAYYVERNRLYTVIKNFPFSMLALVKLYAFARYYWHLVFMITRTGKAAEFRESGHPPWLLPFLVLRAHASALVRLPYLFRERRRIFRTRRLEFEGISRIVGRAFDPGSQGSRVVSRLLILIPAYNEEGAIGGVVNEVRAVMPGSSDSGGRRLFRRCNSPQGACRRRKSSVSARIIWAWAAQCRPDTGSHLNSTSIM